MGIKSCSSQNFQNAPAIILQNYLQHCFQIVALANLMSCLNQVRYMVPVELASLGVYQMNSKPVLFMSYQMMKILTVSFILVRYIFRYSFGMNPRKL